MSNHFSAANLKSPGDDAPPGPDRPLRLRSTLDHPGRTVLIMDANPFIKGNEFHPDAVARSTSTTTRRPGRCRVHLHFSEPKDGRQTATAYHATGEEAQCVNRRARILDRGGRRSASTLWPCPSKPALPSVHRQTQ